MPSFSSKKSSKGTPATTARSLRPIAPSALLPDLIEDAVDLGGEGYVLIKVARGAKLRSAPVRPQQVVAPADLLRLMRRLVGKKHRRAPSQSQGQPEDNQALMAQLHADAMAGRAQLHAAGELLGSAAMQAQLGVSRQALSKAVHERRLFWVDGPGGVHWYPGFFATSRAHRRDLERVSVELGELPGSTKWQFFTTPKHSLAGRTPVQALESGDVDRVLRTAGEFRERSVGR